MFSSASLQSVQLSFFPHKQNFHSESESDSQQQQQHDFLMRTYTIWILYRITFINFLDLHSYAGDSRGYEPNSFIQERGE